MEAGTEVQDATVKSRIVQLEKENSELRLYLASLTKYLGHKGVLRQDEFRKLVDVIDSEDGRADGGYSGRIIK